MTADSGGDHQPQTLRLERSFKATAEQVFEAWTDPDLLKQWWGPPGSVVTVVEVDLRVGGRYRIAIQQKSQATYYVSGAYQTVDRPYRLVFTWRWENPEMDIGQSLVTIELDSDGKKTDLRLIHERLPDEEARRSHAEGWTGILQKLAQFLG